MRVGMGKYLHHIHRGRPRSALQSRQKFDKSYISHTARLSMQGHHQAWCTAKLSLLLQLSTHHVLVEENNAEELKQATGFTLLLSGGCERLPPRTWKPIVGPLCLAITFSC